MEKIESYFHFEITQTIQVLLYKIKMGDGKRWRIEKSDEGMILHQIYPEGVEKQDNQTKVALKGRHTMIITTVSGFVYTIMDKERDGAEVSFHGPLNALLAQSLMPRMTYVPKTLVGMNNLMDDYVPIGEYMRLRKERHNGQENPQDRFGWRLNMRFDNELVPWLPAFNGNKNVHNQKEKRGKFSRR